MAKDKMTKNLDNVMDIVKNAFSSVIKIIDKIIAKIDIIDPSENTRKRVITALILIPLALYAIFYSKSIFFLLVITITIIMTAEWLDLIKKADDQKKWRLIGLFYILIPIYCVIKIRLISSEILFWMFAVIWATDIFAFFAGKTLGGAKLAPDISPNKTWSGLAGGVVASMIIGFLSAFMFSGGVMFFIFISAFLALIEQGGDLVESKFKRIFGVKDSGNIIPGHGGVLDRLDGMMFVAPMVLFIITAFSEKFAS